jgi:hypothetical protein
MLQVGNVTYFIKEFRLLPEALSTSLVRLLKRY